MEKTVFVTVGTTLFEDLISSVMEEKVLKLLSSQGFKKLLIQIGKGNVIPKSGMQYGIEVEFYRYKSSLKEDFEKSFLVISHAGAGSCLEALEANKYLLAVINDKLMNNHQIELAEAFSNFNYCKSCCPSTLYSTLKSFDPKSLTTYKSGDPSKLADYLNSAFNLKPN